MYWPPPYISAYNGKFDLGISVWTVFVLVCVCVCLTKMHISGSPLKGLETKNTFERKMPGAHTGASEHYSPVRGARALWKKAGIGL